VLYDPNENERTAPSSPNSIKHFARIAEKLSVDVEPITKRQLAELAEFDGLFIRETTSIDNQPTALPAAPGRKACRSSTIRSR